MLVWLSPFIPAGWVLGLHADRKGCISGNSAAKKPMLMRIIKYLWMYSIGLEMNTLLYILCRFPFLIKLKFLVRRLDRLADAANDLMVDLGFW